MRCVFDTSVLVSAALLPGSKPRRAFDVALRTGRVLLSFATLSEIHEVLHRPQFRRYIDEQAIRNFLAALIRETEWIEVDQRISVCRDPKDDKFLELAVCGQATHIITGDKDLLALHPFRGVQILPPHVFLGDPPLPSPIPPASSE